MSLFGPGPGRFLVADEVGLGKTIEAGLVLAQKWTEGRRRILVITPANLRKQWSQEIEEKFFLPTIILESRNYNKMSKDGARRPLSRKNWSSARFSLLPATQRSSWSFRGTSSSSTRRTDFATFIGLTTG